MHMNVLTRAVIAALAFALAAPACDGQASPAPSPPAGASRDYRVVHVFVALCDNRNQGIVPVPAALGNGQDPKSNLYWGAQFGADAFFRRSSDWTALAVAGELPPSVLARSAFRSKAPGAKVIVLMEAYDGACMKEALTDFLAAAAGGPGRRFIRVDDGGKWLDVRGWGSADMVCFVGHNGLMEMKRDDAPAKAAGAPQPQCAVVLACMSHPYFKGPLGRAGCPPLITTTQLMSPEAYTLDAIIRSWAAGDAPAGTRDKAAAAYAKYQRCSLPAAKRMFVAGWGEMER